LNIAQFETAKAVQHGETIRQADGLRLPH